MIVLAAALAVGAPGCGPAPAARPSPPATAPAPARPDPGPPWANQWARGQVFYEVFVRSFADSDGDGVGDLRGLIAHLDDLNDGDPGGGDDLGVDALWLMPVFDSPSYHGYDVADYRAIAPDYGTLGDFQALLQAAHERGMRVIVDLPINHTSSTHPWFVSSREGPASPRRGWYTWRPDDPGWTRWDGQPTWRSAGAGAGYFFGVFGGGMPDLALENPQVRAEIESIVRSWLGFGLDGFRLDASPLLFECGVEKGKVQFDCPQTHAYWRDLSRLVRGVKPQAFLVGEAWTDAAKIAPYFGSWQALPGGDELTSSFDFPLATALVEALRTGSAERARAALAEARRLYPAGALDTPFLTNHDQTRLASELEAAPGAAARLRQAPALLLTLPGAPFLYYGEEIGLGQSASPGDLGKRSPMPWDGSTHAGFTAGSPWAPLAPGWQSKNLAAQRADPGSLWHVYRRWIAARRVSAALREGDLEPIEPAPPALLGFVRRTDAEVALVLHNVGDAPLDVAAPTLPGALTPLTPLTPLLVDAGVTLAGGRAHLPGHSSAVWIARRAEAAASAGQTPLPGWEGKLTTYHLASPIPSIAARDVTVLVPPGYGDPAAAARRYPVLYMQDGQNCLDHDPFGHGGWQLHKVSYDLTTRGLMAPVIFVCVQSLGPTRAADFNPGTGAAPGPTADDYLDFIERTVVPFVEARYRTAPGAASRGLGGASYGAIIALHGAWSRPRTFGLAMAMSTAYGRYNFVAVARAAPLPSPRPRVYIDSGTIDYGGGDDDRARTQALRDVLVEKGYSPGRELKHVVGQGHDHNEEYWRRRLPEALPFLFPP